MAEPSHPDNAVRKLMMMAHESTKTLDGALRWLEEARTAFAKSSNKVELTVSVLILPATVMNWSGEPNVINAALETIAEMYAGVRDVIRVASVGEKPEWWRFHHVVRVAARVVVGLVDPEVAAQCDRGLGALHTEVAGHDAALEFLIARHMSAGTKAKLYRDLKAMLRLTHALHKQIAEGDEVAADVGKEVSRDFESTLFEGE